MDQENRVWLNLRLRFRMPERFMIKPVGGDGVVIKKQKKASQLT